MEQVKKNARRREPALKVYCTPEERAEIEKTAQEAGLAVSAFLRRVGRNIVPISTANLEGIKILSKINADQGRLGGLLKALLTNDERLDGYTGDEIRRLSESLLKEIADTQKLLMEEMQKLMEEKANDCKTFTHE